ISYLGSVFLPLAMFMIILNTCKIEYKKWLPFPLILISSVVFIIAASPVYLDIYYKSVSLKTVNGVSVLDKAYGSWHCIYLYYLIGYFLAMIAVIVFSCMKKKINSPIHASIIATAVFVNIGVWLFEQFVKVDLEFLSISYIISEIFLLMLNLLIQEHTENHIPAIAEPKIIPVVAVEKTPEFKPEIKMPTEEAVSTDEIILTEQEVSADEEFSLKCEYFKSRLYTLTPTEKEIYSLYLKGNRTKDIMESLNIKENTIKYHNKNIYSKLGVSSRKELLKIANCIVVEA
ncbi:MAG: LuxR C-terminal-related transcriptional regulator, partial [Ruminococcus sp.]|nr:LuxR C-terminal-related transcriptional regulator [Ruminococcus sp.]